MDADTLRNLQTPIKQSYKDDPAKALVILSAEGSVHVKDIACAVGTPSGEVVAGLHPAAGGDGSQACSGDMLLQALVACSGVTFSAVAIAIGVPVEAAKIRAEAVMDFRGTLGVDRTAPVGITSLTLQFEIRSTADDEKLSKLISLTERYCVVLQTLAQPAALRSSWKRS